MYTLLQRLFHRASPEPEDRGPYEQRPIAIDASAIPSVHLDDVITSKRELRRALARKSS